MRPSLYSFLITGLIVCCLLIASKTSASLDIITPFNKSFVDHELVNVVLKVDKSTVDTVKITNLRHRRGREPFSVEIAVERDIVCYSGINLFRGLNKIEISGLKGGKTVEKKAVVVFYRVARSKRYQKAPSSFILLFFHIAEYEEICSPCHQMEPVEIDKKPPKPEDSSCFTCHRRITEYKFVHGPVSTWSCLSCHKSDAKDWKYSVLKPDSKVCFECHEDNMKLWESKKFRHGPSLSDCTICHNPHASDEPFWVHTHATKLCLACHEGKQTGAHVISGFGGKGHPTAGRPDPMRPGREFTCAGCHNPHAGDSQDFLYYDNKNMSYFCTVCHQR
jgi:predicted CXXCH cytochrome family protein